MKSKDKIIKINENLIKMNNEVLKNKTFKITFDNNTPNNYILILKGKSFKFNTYDDILSCLELFILMFRKEEENEFTRKRPKNNVVKRKTTL